VVDECGLVDNHYVHLDPRTGWESEEETISEGVFTSSLLSTKGRYKPIFHWNERIAQLSCTDPDLPKRDMERIWFEVFDGSHGPVKISPELM
jgi:hypothetical protein